MTSPRTRRARFRSLTAERIAPAMFEVERLGDAGDAHVVDLREGACDCRDFEFRMGPAGGDCYHLRYLKLVFDGALCPHCGYETCRPSCPERSTDFEETHQ
jgi:hypothetical protein